MIRIKLIFATVAMLGIPNMLNSSPTIESRIASGITGVSALIFVILSTRDYIKDKKK